MSHDTTQNDGESSTTYRDTDEMSLEELRKHYDELLDDIDHFGGYEGQEDVWERHIEVWAALEARSDVEQPACPECGTRKWRWAAGDGPACAECGAGAWQDGLEQKIAEAADRIRLGPSEGATADE